jgi:mannose-1-phosphate guanylyltransferase
MRAVILAAGLGTRLWPLSTPAEPKQFQPLINDQPLLNYTYDLLNRLINKDELYVQVLRDHVDHVRRLLPDIDASKIIAIAEHRDTLAETFWAINYLSTSHQPILFKSVDQYITDEDDFLNKLKIAIENNSSRTSAIDLLAADFESYSPNSGYMTTDDTGIITSFIEKPSEETVNNLLQSQRLYRSLFIFIVQPQLLLNVLNGLNEPWVDLSRNLLNSQVDTRESAFLKMPVVDISSTLFEAATRLHLSSVGKSSNFFDVGRYSALYELNSKDVNDNVIIGNVKMSSNCNSSLVINMSNSILKVTSLDHALVVNTPAGSLVAKMIDVDALKNL